MSYEHHSERVYTGRALSAMTDCNIPAKVKPLLALLVRLSKSGKRPVFATAGWLAGALGRVVSVFYEHRSILVELGLIRVDEQRVGYDRSAPSHIYVLAVRELASDFVRETARRWMTAWRDGRSKRRAERAAREKARNCGSPENRRQNGTNKISSSKKSDFRFESALNGLTQACLGRLKEPDTPQRQAMRAGYGMTAEVLALIPDRE